MERLKYTVIKGIEQYNQYCKILEELVEQAVSDSRFDDEVELLTLLIEKYDEANSSWTASNPIELLQSFMSDHDLKPKHIVSILGVSKGYVSDILHYRKGLSKDVIRKLAEYFNVRQEAFNRPYKLICPINSHLKNASVMNTVKTTAIAH